MKDFKNNFKSVYMNVIYDPNFYTEYIKEIILLAQKSGMRIELDTEDNEIIVENTVSEDISVLKLKEAMSNY